MTLETVVLLVACLCFMTCIVAQRFYIHTLEQKIRSTRTEVRWTCGECENAEYILKAVE